VPLIATEAQRCVLGQPASSRQTEPQTFCVVPALYADGKLEVGAQFGWDCNAGLAHRELDLLATTCDRAGKLPSIVGNLSTSAGSNGA